MTPEFFDELMDLIDHKISTAIKHGYLTTKIIRDKQSALRMKLSTDGTVQKESVPIEPEQPHIELQSDVIKARIATLKQERINVEQSDDRAFSNGRLTNIDAEIRSLQLELNVLENKRDLP